MVTALLKELEIRSNYLEGEPVETIYFGGGTPSLLSLPEIRTLMARICSLYPVAAGAEVTLEANPDDISEAVSEEWLEAGITRLSLGVQSFFDEDLAWMNRAHGAAQAQQSIDLIRKTGFTNFSIDLIYGTPTLDNTRWTENIRIATSQQIPHISSYALTVEDKTPLKKMIRLAQKQDVDPDRQAAQFSILMDELEHAGYEHYEISNFSLPGFRSRHNTSYWQGKQYLGIGPSAHSFNGRYREWNVANNSVYIGGILENQPVSEKERLRPVDQLNEYIMTSLRTVEGMDLEKVGEYWGAERVPELAERSRLYISEGLAVQEGNHLRLSKKGRFLADGIAARLFFDQW